MLDNVIEITETKTIGCKNCGSTAVVRFGTYKGNQRYYCKDCNRKFKADGTSFHAKKPTEWESSAVDMYFRGSAISDIQAHLQAQYSYSPSNSIIYKWVNKYTDVARKHFRDYHPEVGDLWIADETMLDVDGQHKVWFYDIIDEKTRFLLASRVTVSRTTKDAEMVMRDAEKCAGKKPVEVITDQNNSYVNGIPQAFEGNTDHIIGYPFAKRDSGISTSEIERFHSTLKDRTKVFRAFRDVETLIQFTDGWLVYYNYFRPHTSLDGKTPAEEANVPYTIKNWKDLASMPVSKQSEIDTHKNPKIIIPKIKIDLTNAFKRKQASKPKTLNYEGESIGSMWRKRRLDNLKVLISTQKPRKTPKPPRITKQHYSKRGGGLTRRGDI